MTREPGYYYVRFPSKARSIEAIVEYSGVEWELFGDRVSESAFETIGPKVPTREEWEAAQRDHEAMEVLRSHGIDSVSWKDELEPQVWRAWNYGMRYWRQAEQSSSDDPATAILRAAEAAEQEQKP